MKKSFIATFVILLMELAGPAASAQQIPFLSELLSRSEQFHAKLNQKRNGANLSSIDPLRKRGEEAFLKGDIHTGYLDAFLNAEHAAT